jgi:hypothetical protein
LNGVVKSLAIVAQHVIRGAASDHVADPLGAGQGGGFEVLAMQSDIQVSENCEDDEHDGEQGTDQLRADAVSQPLGSASAANWVSLRHGNTGAATHGSDFSWVRNAFFTGAWASGKSAGTSANPKRAKPRDDHERDRELGPLRRVVMPDVGLKADERDIEAVGDEPEHGTDGGQIQKLGDSRTFLKLSMVMGITKVSASSSQRK